MLMPWQQAPWAELQRQWQRLPHALLLTGPTGIGKRRFAEHLAQALLCESVDQAAPCGQCQACLWFLGSNHPDYRLLSLDQDEGDEPDAKESKESKEKKAPTQIKIEAVRGLADFLGLSSHRGGRRVIVIEPAEAMNVATANALLKMLEEPPPECHFLLVSHTWRRLLPTIRSRCRQWPLAAPETALATSWLTQQGLDRAEERLAAAGGAPLLAQAEAANDLAGHRDWWLQALAERGKLDVLRLAEEAEKRKLPMTEWVDWTQKWLADLANLALAGTSRFYPARLSQARLLAEQVDPRQLFALADTLVQQRQLANHPLNQRMVLEQLLFAYQSAIHPRQQHKG